MCDGLALLASCRGGPIPRRAPKHVAFSVIATHLSHRLASNARQSNTSRWRWIGRWTQFRDQPQDVAEQMPGDGDLGHLKRDVTTVAHNLRTNLDQPLLQDRHRPVFDRLRRRQRAQEITEMAGLDNPQIRRRIGTFGDLTVTHARPSFGIESITIDNRSCKVTEEAAYSTPFATLLRFRKDNL